MMDDDDEIDNSHFSSFFVANFMIWLVLSYSRHIIQCVNIILSNTPPNVLNNNSNSGNNIIMRHVKNDFFPWRAAWASYCFFCYLEKNLALNISYKDDNNFCSSLLYMYIYINWFDLVFALYGEHPKPTLLTLVTSPSSSSMKKFRDVPEIPDWI